jgi:iron complex outermembrane receptor protein
MELWLPRFRARIVAYAPLLFLACAWHARAEAQAVANQAVDPDAIIITARKHDERLARAAAPVSVATGKELVETRTSHTADLNERFPALTVQPTATGNLIFIRGLL